MELAPVFSLSASPVATLSVPTPLVSSASASEAELTRAEGTEGVATGQGASFGKHYTRLESTGCAQEECDASM